MTKDEWYATGPGRSMCRECGEDVLIDEVADLRGVQNVCKVCCHAWWIHGPLTPAQYKTLPRKP